MLRFPWLTPVTLILVALLALPSWARQDLVLCGTHRDKPQEELFLHRKAQEQRKKMRLDAAAPRPARADIGQIAILEDSDGVVARRNPFNLEIRTLTFTPVAAVAARYRFEVAQASYDADLASRGAPVSGLGDDDTRSYFLPFAFPFYGKSYQQVFVNADGNLTFGTGDGATSERSLGRMTAGPPRIAPLFEDLDPSRARDSVRVLSEAGRFVVSFVDVPEYSDFTFAPRVTFQARLYPDGRIELAWDNVNTTGAIAGITPGGLLGSTTILSFVQGSTQEFSGTVAERFGTVEELDLATAAQKFYETHDDAYDYLVFYNAFGMPASSGAVAFESTVRNNRGGYGDVQVDIGREFGSANRLQAVLNLGPLIQYPLDPNAFVPARRTSRDTPLTVIAHETGHLFLAFASVRDAQDPNARPMLGYQNAHWAFTTNSEASLLEGNRIRDNGPGNTPRFTTVAVTEGYSPLDQYLMGLRAAEEVPPTFYVDGAGTSFLRRQPQVGVDFGGERRDVRVEDIIVAEGRRTPDYTVAQRRFRFAFILVVRAGTTLAETDLATLDNYRRQFETYYDQATSGRAKADTSLKFALQLSAHPAAGVVAGQPARGTVSIARPAETSLIVSLKSRDGLLGIPDSVNIAAGATSATFTINGLRAGVDELTAEPGDGRFDSAVARIAVAADVGALTLEGLSGDKQIATAGEALRDPVVVRVRDVNRLPYGGLKVEATTTGNGSVTPASLDTDEFGRAAFSWTPGSQADPALRLRLAGNPAAVVDITTLGVRALGTAVNAASFAATLAPGGLGTFFGANLTSGGPAAATSLPWPQSLGGLQLLIGGKPAALLFVGPGQVNFLAPDDLPIGPAAISVAADGLISVRENAATVARVAPGIFFDAATHYGAILLAGTAITTQQQAAAAGQIVEVYGTGLGPVRTEASGLRTATSAVTATIGGVTARVLYAGLAPGYLGLYQVNLEVPARAGAGPQSLALAVDGVASNSVTIGVR